MAQADTILNLLKERGDVGASNFELMEISYQYPARIHTLRHKRGYNITTTHVNDKEWRIKLVVAAPAEESEPEEPEEVEEVVHAISWLYD